MATNGPKGNSKQAKVKEIEGKRFLTLEKSTINTKKKEKGKSYLKEKKRDSRNSSLEKEVRKQRKLEEEKEENGGQTYKPP